MTIYVSGQITGLDLEVAKQYFKKASEKINSSGHIAVNPMEILPYHPDYTWHDYMAEDLKVLIRCDAILMLDNWTNSKGAKIEHAVAVGLGLQLFYNKNHNF